MRAEDKAVDGLELERETERQRESELEKEDEEELPELQSSEDRNSEHRAQVITAMQKIFDGDHVVVDELELPARELRALEALKAAVDGKDAMLSQFIYATDRKALLEQALAILQRNFVTGDAEHAQVLGAYHDLIEKVAALRHSLIELADSQDELLHPTDRTAMLKADGDKDDDDQDDDAKPKTSTLSDGPEVKPEPKTSTLSDGPAVKAEPKPTTVGDPADLAEAQKTPWWKRALGRD